MINLRRAAAVAATALGLALGALAAPASAFTIVPDVGAGGGVYVKSARMVSDGGLSPNDTGSVLCSGNLCIQRVTSIVNHKATIAAWAVNSGFTGHFELLGPDGHIANHPTTGDQKWAVGQSTQFTGVAQGGGYTIKEWVGTASTGWHTAGVVNFSV